MRIGLLSTGIMGWPMARRLAEAGHAVGAWNRSPGNAAALAGHGVALAATPLAAVAEAEVVIGMLGSGPVCDAVLLAGGVLAAMRPGSLLAVMSSIPAEAARRHAGLAAARGVASLDAPASGGERGAREGTLSIMAGGAEADFARALPVFRPLGRATHVGPAGAGQLAKLANQVIVAGSIATVAEALLLAERGGADAGRVRDALLGGFAESTVLRQHALRMIGRDFVPGGPAKYQVKDTGTALGLCAALGLDLPVLRLVDRLFADMVAHGDGDLDHSAIIQELRRRNRLAMD
ncbi:NAD(P)-dependent oxidoreductase [Dankookia rubra]|nr:NAD(P)-dependent oxidoreductase [Dankookia rubra]